MFHFLNTVLGAIIGGILYPLLITAPLQILNGIYQAFSFCCGASIGQMFFNSTGTSISIDPTTPLFQFMVRAIIIALILMVLFIIVLSIEHLVTKKKVNYLSKIKWPILAITSTVTVPIAFILMSTLSTALMSLVGGTTIKVYVASSYINEIYNTMTSAMNRLATNLNITLPDIDGKNFDASLINVFNALKTGITNISMAAQKAGLTDLVEKCRTTNDYLDTMMNLWTNFNTEIVVPFNEVMNWMIDPQHTKGTAVITDATIASKLKTVMNKLTTFQANWSMTISNINSILKDAQIYCKDADVEIIIKDISGNDQKIKAFALLSKVQANWNFESNPFANFNKLWLDLDKSNKSLLTVMLLGGEWGEYKISELEVCLDHVSAGIDPQTSNTFNLVIQIYRLVTGNNDSNWTGVWNMSKGLTLVNVGVGFIIIVGATFVTGLFGIMAARRLIELAVLAVFSIISAVMGIKDDGAKFTNTIKLIIVKMFTIIIAWAAFTLSVTLLNTITSFIQRNNGGLDPHGLAWGIVQAIIMVGGLLGAYHISILLQQWMGDSTSIQGTLADMGALKSMMGAGAIAGVAATGAKFAATKFTAGVGKAITHKRDIASQKIMQLAERKGLGHIEYKLNAKGKPLAVGFKFTGDARESSIAYKKLIKSKDWKKEVLPGSWKNRKEENAVQKALKKMEKRNPSNKH